jgi:hypothetical protein
METSEDEFKDAIPGHFPAAPPHRLSARRSAIRQVSLSMALVFALGATVVLVRQARSVAEQRLYRVTAGPSYAVLDRPPLGYIPPWEWTSSEWRQLLP